jgi:purine-binding chemotaxis protein CheW
MSTGSGFPRGVINQRGKIIPVIDLRAKFAMPTIEKTDLSCIIVLDVPWDGRVIPMGILVDAVSEVLAIDEDHLEDTPAFGAGVDTAFILGVGKIDQRVVMLLDVDRVLTGTEMQMVQQAAKAA